MNAVYNDHTLKYALSFVLNEEADWITPKLKDLAQTIKARMFRQESGTPITKYIHDAELKVLKYAVRRVKEFEKTNRAGNQG